MGEPVTKSVLTILTKVAETLARRSVSPTNVVPVNHYFNSAGDDQLDCSSLAKYTGLKASAPTVGLKPSDEKFGAFKIATNYCEQIVTFGSLKNPKPELDNNSCLVDILKVRLFSPESK
jgi:hypothetical protein